MKVVSYSNGFPKALALTVALLTTALPVSALAKAEGPGVPVSLSDSRPNIILVMTDDQGMGDLSGTGNPILRTPQIDQFAEQSTRLTDFHVSPTCAPTRAAIMSGRRPFEVGVTHTILQRERMALDVITMPQALQQAGYQTGLFGKWHLGDEEEYLPQNRGFDEVLMHGGGGIGQYQFGDFEANTQNTYFDNVLLHNDTIVKTEGFCTDVFFESALSWIKEQHDAKQTYFAYISLNAPHGPMFAPEEYKKRFLDEGYDENTAARYGMIENIDDNFGRLMRNLDEWQALDNTLVIFMTDNGMSMAPIKKGKEKIMPFNAGMKGRKNSAWEGGTHVPAFWYWKGVLHEGVDIEALTAHVDMYRTFAELAGAEIPKSKLPPGGRSMVALLEDSQAEWPDRKLFVHKGRWDDGRKNNLSREANKYNGAAVRTQQWRLVYSLQKGEVKRHLSDISTNPGENVNIVAQYPQVVQELDAAYDAWWQSTEPFLVNENLPLVPPEKMPFTLRYNEQLQKTGIPQWAPGQEQAGSTTNVPAVTSDIMPTVLAWAGIEIPSERLLDGKNLDAIILGEETSRNSPIGFESQYQLAWTDDRYKLVFVPQNLDAQAKQAARHNQNPAADFEFELYDIVNDPEESINIATQNPEIVRQMSQQLSGWRNSVARSIEGLDP